MTKDEALEFVRVLPPIGAGGQYIAVCSWPECPYRSKTQDSAGKVEHQASEHVRDKHG